MACALLLGAAHPLAAQGSDPTALSLYYRAVGEHFSVPAAEILILSEWRLPPEEIPVVLWMARRAGISPDAVVALRQAGRDWSDVAARYRVNASAFHVVLDGNGGSLAHAYESYRGRPAGEWSSIQLDDGEIVGLVNLGVLADILRASPAALLQTRDRTGSWVDAFRTLSRR
ncbi:MAG: hypothetical protein EXR95_07315 [Gemmatimonadetes bacterium]|nr:hypothetical protein [Gemmatimonadota bacterium]